MDKKMISLVLVMILVVFAVTPVAAITGGQLDGDGHPYAGLVLVPGVGVCSGTLIDEDLVLTAGHCTDFFENYPGVETVWVTFDSEAAVDLDTWEVIPDEGTWHLAHDWATHPGYVDADWPFTADYGLLFLDEPVTGITPAALPEEGLLAELIGTTGQTKQRFYDVGYGQNGVTVGGGPPVSYFNFVRKISEQRYNPSKGSVGTLDPTWLILGNVPSEQHGSGCGGDSGSGIFLDPQGPLGTTVVAVHTGGYRLGYDGNLCGRITSLNHRVDIPAVLDWIAGYMD
jgi:hypothetical protein